jgi:hypothetical protein
MRMNQYGAQAERHWRRWLPTRYASLEDPAAYFTALGDEVAEAIDDLTAALAGDDPAGEGYLDKLRRLNMARFDATAQVLRERVLLPPEPGLEDPEGELEALEQALTVPPDWQPMRSDPTSDPNHPYWEQMLLTQDPEDPTEPPPPLPPHP